MKSRAYDEYEALLQILTHSTGAIKKVVRNFLITMF